MMVKLLIIWLLVTVVMFSQTSLVTVMQPARPYSSNTVDHHLPGKKSPKETSCDEKEVMSFEAVALTAQQDFPAPLFRDIKLIPALQQYSFYTLLFSNPHWKPPTSSC